MRHRCVVSIVLGAAGAGAFAQVATFTPLPDLPGGGAAGGAAAIRADGLMAAGSSQGADGWEATRWTLARQGGQIVVTAVEGCGYLSSEYPQSAAYCLTDDGVVFGSSAYTTNGVGQPAAQAFRWSPSEGMVGLGFPPGSQDLPQSVALGCSADGAKLCGYGNNTTPTLSIVRRDGEWLFVDTGGVPRPFGMLRAMSREGSVAVGYEREGAGTLYFTLSFDQQRVERLFLGQGKGVSPNGAWACGAAGDPPEMSAVLVEIGRPEEVIGNPSPGEWAVATTVAGHGRVAFVRTGAAAESQRAWRWERYSGRFVPLKALLEDTYGLDLAGWELSDVAAMDADGRAIVGSGFNPAGEQQGFHVTLPYVCPGDHDRNGAFDIRDALAFLNDWSAERPAADADNDGAIDTRDVTFFLNRWAGGC